MQTLLFTLFACFLGAAFILNIASRMEIVSEEVPGAHRVRSYGLWGRVVYLTPRGLKYRRTAFLLQVCALAAVIGWVVLQVS